MHDESSLLLDLKRNRQNLFLMLQLCRDLSATCSSIDRLPAAIKQQLSLEEKISDQLNFSLPLPHLEQHQEVNRQITDLAKRYAQDTISKQDFLMLLDAYYYGHFLGYDQQHFLDMCRKLDAADIAG